MNSLTKPLLLLFFAIACAPKSEVQLTDLDGNRYTTKKYGQTTWMTENLRVKQDKSGNPITFYFPNDDAGNEKDYGLLYDYPTACEVCPEGWHLPNNQDWVSLFELEKTNVSGKFKDSEFWKGESNSDVSGFSVRPTGYGNNGEHHNQFESKTLFWSISKEDDHYVWTYIFEKGNDTIRWASQHPTYANAVRCIKDNSLE